MRKIISNSYYNYSAQYDAFPYQHEAFLELKDKPYSAIFHEQGLGKTKIAIDLLLYWLQYKDIDTVLIVTKKTLVQNWYNEFGVHTHLRPKIMDSNKGSNFYILNSPAKVIITNFETISGEKDRLKLFLESRNVAIVIDESTKIKNPESKLTQDFFELAPLFKIKNIMTGTPVANRPYDIWAQIYFLDHGESLGTNFEEFKKNTNLSNDLYLSKSKQNIFEESVASIFKKIKDFSVRETKNSSIVSLPSKVYVNILVPFENKQKEMYEQIRRDMEIELTHGNTKVFDESNTTIKRLLRLVQVASNPKLIDDKYLGLSAKEIALDELLNDILLKNEKAIVWSIFTMNIDSLCARYKKYKAVKITGKMSVADRNKSVEAFKNGDAQILFATPQSAKEGLTLTVANNAIFYERGFNLDDYLQAQDRIHRISQKKECYIYNLMIENSIDRWIDVLLKAKQNAAHLAQGDIDRCEYNFIADYSFADIVKKILKND